MICPVQVRKREGHIFCIMTELSCVTLTLPQPVCDVPGWVKQRFYKKKKKKGRKIEAWE